MPLQKLLEQLNIPEREAQVYIALVQLGLTGVGPIVTKTKLHRMLVYQSLEKLKDMSMASMVMKNGRQHWQATNPSVILDRVRRQEEIAKQVVASLEQLRQKAQDDLHVQILYGRQGLLDNLQGGIESAAQGDKIVRIIGGANDQVFYDLLGSWYKTYADLQQKYGVKKQLIAPVNTSDLFRKHYSAEKGSEFRFMPAGISSPTFTRITNEMVSIEVYGQEPIIIQIRNKTIAQAYLESFALLWQAGTKA
jgi:hypothetical protein